MEKEWFDNLTDEQKTKLRELDGSSESIIAFCRQEKLDLPDDVLDAVAGGGIIVFTLIHQMDVIWGIIIVTFGKEIQKNRIHPLLRKMVFEGFSAAKLLDLPVLSGNN